VCFDFFYNLCLKHFSFSEDIYIYVGLNANYSLFLSDINETWFSLTDFRKILKYKVSRQSGRTYIIKLIFAFRNFANEPNKKESDV
jgi:hypothetical protein